MTTDGTQPAGPQPAGWPWYRTPDRRLLALGVTLQLVLGTLFGHAYDTRVFMATGYLVSTGRGAYSPLDLTPVFGHAGFERLTTIGYPPPWPLVTGLLYRLTFEVAPNLWAYGLALKLPVIAASVGLAYLVAAGLRRAGADERVCRRAWTALLFNPLLLLTAAAWGQIDAIVALLSVGALLLVWSGRSAVPAALLALAVCTKPVAAPVALAVLVWLAWRAPRTAVVFGAQLTAWSVVLVALPVAVLGWPTAQIAARPNAQFLMTGGLSLTTVARLARDPLTLPGHWWLLGLAWVAALAVALALVPRGAGLADLLRAAAVATLVFLLTRAFVAEPNAVLLLPVATMLAALGELDRRLVTALWALPLAFAVANAAPVQLLWLSFPGAMDDVLGAFAAHRSALPLVRAALVLAWQIAGWWTVVTLVRGSRVRPAAAAGAPA